MQWVRLPLLKLIICNGLKDLAWIRQTPVLATCEGTFPAYSIIISCEIGIKLNNCNMQNEVTSSYQKWDYMRSQMDRVCNATGILMRTQKQLGRGDESHQKLDDDYHSPLKRATRSLSCDLDVIIEINYWQLIQYEILEKRVTCIRNGQTQLLVQWPVCRQSTMQMPTGELLMCLWGNPWKRGGSFIDIALPVPFYNILNLKQSF